MPSTRSSDPRPPKTHILDFFYDDENSCAFTARIKDQRFHIIVDPTNLKPESSDDGPMLTEYLKLLRSVRRNDESQGLPEEPAKPGGKESPRSEDRDSGVDVGADNEKEAAAGKTHDQPSNPEVDPALELQNWVLECFGNEVPQQSETEPDSTPHRSIQAWYEVAVNYYEVHLTTDEQHIKPVCIEQEANLQRRVDDLLPRLPLPKKLRSLSIPWIPAEQVTVLAETDEPPPIHPSLVHANLQGGDKKTYFFKPVDPTQPQPPKREIELLHRVHSEGLAAQFHVPKIEALVGWRDSKIEAMGHLLSVIDDPVPLTKLLDSEVDESKRQRWARESEKVVQTLHEHGIVWGDAKADNFLVDKENQLWVIDFGGSYTEGWVDAELNETTEGDDMALEKIVKGLKDPDGMTVDFDEGLAEARGGGGGSGSGEKRKRGENEDGEDGPSEDECKRPKR